MLVHAGRYHEAVFLLGESLQRWRRPAVEAAYEGLRRDGRLPSTWEVVYGHAWATGSVPAPDGEARFPLDRIGRRTP